MAAKIDQAKSSSSKPRLNPKSRNDNVWFIAGTDIVPIPKFDPDSVHEYLSGKGNEGVRSGDLKVRIRQHLASVGWIIEYFRESRGKGMIRMRYTSPQGKIFMSLILVCKALLEHDRSVSLHPSSAIVEQLQEDLPLSVVNNSLAVNDEPVFYEPEYNLEALLDYVSIGDQNKDDNCNWYWDPNVRDIQLRVRKHLSSLGWRFWYSGKKKKRELRYCSPRGRIYVSLVAACRQCMNEGVRSVARVGVGSPKNSMEIVQHDSTMKDTCTRKGLRKRNSTHLIEKTVEEDNPEASSCFKSLKPQTVLSLLIDNKVVLPLAKVFYFSSKDNLPSAQGQITTKGIKCACCGEIFSLTKFEAHAGSTNHRPAANIFLEDGRSILECQIQLRNKNMLRFKRKLRGRPRTVNDDICSVCRKDGLLTLCDKCLSSYHLKCLGLKVVPDGDWFCPSCCCGSCGRIKLSEDTNGLNNDSFIHCEQCQHNYHTECLKEMARADPRNVPMKNCFCSKRCEDICLGLTSRLGICIPVGPVEDDLTWTLWKCVCSTFDPYQEAESYSKLDAAINVMHACFNPSKVEKTKRDLVEDVIFCQRSKLNRLNFEGFFTVILEKDDELVSTAFVRIHGEKVAELPFVATSSLHSGSNKCRIMMNELEKMLMELGIQRLVLPSVCNTLDMWKYSFGFSEIKNPEMYMNNTFINFDDTIMCEKLLGDTSSENKTDFSVKYLENQVKDSRIMDICIPPHQDALGSVVSNEELGVLQESQFGHFAVVYKRRCMLDKTKRRYGLVDTTRLF